MRTIKTQNGYGIVNVDSIVSVYVHDAQGQHYMKCETVKDYEYLGEYSIEKRALDVLDKLNTWLTAHLDYHSDMIVNDDTEKLMREYMHFTMPQNDGDR